MREFAFDPHLLEGCFRLGRLELCHVLLMDNAALPWFVLVPDTDVIELCDLAPAPHARLFEEAHTVARFVREQHAIDKLNVATLGNVVRQLHLHVVGRRRDDYCWPGPVWGTTPPTRYAHAEVVALRARLATAFGADFRGYVDG